MAEFWVQPLTLAQVDKMERRLRRRQWEWWRWTFGRRNAATEWGYDPGAKTETPCFSSNYAARKKE